MVYRRIWVVLTVLMALSLLACAPGQSPSPQAISPSQITGGKEVATGQAWEAEWEKTLSAARKEGKVVVYGSSTAPAVRQVAPEFYKKYGFELEVQAMDKGSALTAKLFMERRARLYLVDVMLTGTNNAVNEILPEGAAASLEHELILPEVLDPKSWYTGKLPWLGDERLVFMAYAFPVAPMAINTELVKKDEINSFNDLFNPRWKGKILMNDPTISGVGLKSFSVFGFYVLNLDFYRQLAKQEPAIIRDQRLQVEWLAKGKYHILLAPRPAPMMEFMRAGAPVAYVVPQEGTYIATGGGNITLAKNAPHPRAARVFINWFLSREGQSLVTAIEGAQSARADVPIQALDPLSVRQPGVKYFTGADTKEFLLRDPEYTKAAQEIFGHLMK